MAEEMVLVGCKMPNGVILNLDAYERPDPHRNEVNRIEGPETVTLQGWAHEFNKPSPTEGTFGARLNPVSKAFWEAWLETHADSPLLKDGLIIPPPNSSGRNNAVAQARDEQTRPQMFPPVQPNDARAGRNGVTALTKDD